MALRQERGAQMGMRTESVQEGNAVLCLDWSEDSRGIESKSCFHSQRPE